MKPSTFAYGLGAALLAASALCLGARHAMDLRPRGATGGGGRVIPTTRIVDESGHAPGRLESLPGETPEAAMARCLRPLLTTANGADLIRSMLKLIAQFQPEDFPVALEAARSMGLGNLTGGYRLMLSAWGESDRTAMMAWAEKHGDLSVTLTDWSLVEPDAAMTWLLAPERKHDAAWDLLMASAIAPLASDLPALGRVLAAVPEEHIPNILAQCHMELKGAESDELNAWFGTLDPRIQKSVMMGMFTSELTGAQRLALVVAYPDATRPGDLQATYTVWAAENPDVAAAELEHLEPGVRFDGLLDGLVRNLAAKNEMAACLELLRRWPDRVNDSLTLYVADRLQDHPEEASELIRMAKDPYRRSDAYADLLRPWFASDAGAARQWLDAHDEVPDTVRKQFAGK